MNAEINWHQIRTALAAPFPVEVVSWRLDSDGREYQGKMLARAVCYIDARDVQERLDAVCGVDGWSFAVTMTPGGKMYAALGTLTIAGVSKCDAGEDETVKGAVSDALKRSAVQWGIGRYLYAVGSCFAEVEQRGKDWRLTQTGLEKLRAKLPRPDRAA